MTQCPICGLLGFDITEEEFDWGFGVRIPMCMIIKEVSRNDSS